MEEKPSFTEGPPKGWASPVLISRTGLLNLPLNTCIGLISALDGDWRYLVSHEIKWQNPIKALSHNQNTLNGSCEDKRGS